MKTKEGRMKRAGVVIMSFLAVSCTGLDRHIHDTVNPYGTPNTPDSQSETAQRVRGAKLSTVPILPETGDVWPGQPEPVPSLQDVSRSNAHFIEKWRKAQPQLEEDLKQQLADGQGMAVGEDVGKQYGSGKEVVPIGKPITSHVQDNAPPYLEPVSSGTVAIPNGDGTDTLIAPDGSVKIVSKDKAALFEKAKTFQPGGSDTGSRAAPSHSREDGEPTAQAQPQARKDVVVVPPVPSQPKDDVAVAHSRPQPEAPVVAEPPHRQARKDVAVPPPPPMPKDDVAVAHPRPQPEAPAVAEPPHRQVQRDVAIAPPPPMPKNDVAVAHPRPQPQKEVAVEAPHSRDDVVVKLPRSQSEEAVTVKPSRHHKHKEDVVVEVPENATVSVKSRKDKTERKHAHKRHEEAEKHPAVVSEKHKTVPEKHRARPEKAPEKKHHSHEQQGDDFVDMMGYSSPKSHKRSHHHDDGGVYQFDWDK